MFWAQGFGGLILGFRGFRAYLTLVRGSGM